MVWFKIKSVMNIEVPRKNHPWRYLIYLTTAWGAASFVGLIGAYAIIKKSMGE